MSSYSFRTMTALKLHKIYSNNKIYRKIIIVMPQKCTQNLQKAAQKHDLAPKKN